MPSRLESQSSLDVVGPAAGWGHCRGRGDLFTLPQVQKVCLRTSVEWFFNGAFVSCWKLENLKTRIVVNYPEITTICVFLCISYNFFYLSIMWYSAFNRTKTVLGLLFIILFFTSLFDFLAYAHTYRVLECSIHIRLYQK